MAILEQIRHQVAIAGRVTDAASQQPIWHARVSVTAAPAAFTDRLAERRKQYGTAWETLAERPDRVQSARDGHFHFLDLPDGQYTLAVSLPGAGSRYGAAQVNVAVARDGQGNVHLGIAEVVLPPTTLKGRVTFQSAAVVMASVRVKGSGETAYTDQEGKYLLAGLETGTRTIVVSARSCKDAAQQVVLVNAGGTQALDFALIANG